jgi:site-specific DNA-methyltransferase (adenine-specific)
MKSKIKNQILNVDCFKILPKIPNNSIDAIISDPPYGQNLKYGIKKVRIKNDKNLDWLFSFSYNAYRILKNDSFCILFWQWRTFNTLIHIMKLAGFKLKTVAIWDKQIPGLGNGLTEQYELIVFFRKSLKARCNKYRGNIFRCTKICKNSKHPHQKPIGLLKEIILLTTKKKDLVFDPFLGIASTSLACIETGRRYLGTEINKRFFKIAKQRIKKVISL